jgi:transcriptional regulator with GAF, ATPase, and Fis domain
MGVLYNDNRLMTKVFNDYELKVLSYFAAQAALALDNAMAYEHIEQLNRKLEEEKLYYEEQQMQQGGADTILGESGATQRLISQIKHVAPSDTTVLILGETGVGKDLAAQTIHRLSHRADGPYISVQCSALPEGLISSELFGHEKGAYTGAVKQRVGRFELADKGTLFLDEIGTLSMDIQIRLLRVLQSKEFERIGGGKTVESDFRLVTATNVDLEAEVRAGRFREDLFYRINVFPVYIPPLRERTEDIPLLAMHFLRSYAAKREKPSGFCEIDDKDMRRLVAYDWKGNIRELENIIERGVILSPGPRFELPELVFPKDTCVAPTEHLTLVENERRHILRALQETGWKVHGPGGAAEILDINPSTLVSRMRKHGIKRPNSRKKKGITR